MLFITSVNELIVNIYKLKTIMKVHLTFFSFYVFIMYTYLAVKDYIQIIGKHITKENKVQFAPIEIDSVLLV